MTALAKLVAYWRKRAPDLVPYTVAADQLESALASPAELGGVPAAWIYEELHGHKDDAWIERINRTLPVWETRNAQPLYTTPRAAEAVTLAEIRTAVADYMRSEGCSCCRDSEAHEVNTERLAKLLNVGPYDDGSGYDFSPSRSSSLTPPSAKGE